MLLQQFFCSIEPPQTQHLPCIPSPWVSALYRSQTNGSLRPDVVVQSALTSLRRKFEQVGEECTRLDGGGDVDMGGIAAAPHAGGMDDAWHGAGDFGASQF